MIELKKLYSQWGRFFSSIVLPTLVAIILTISAIYFVIIPAFEKSFMDGKKNSIRELTKAAWSVIEFYYNEEVEGRLTRDEAQSKTLAVLKTIRYGEDNKDYFWVTDNTPTMIMHPYSKELVGADLSSYRDPKGKRIFQEIKDIVEHQSSGFIDYSWNKYAANFTVPKLSFVKRFNEWDWVVGTGVFLDDVELKTAQITSRLSRLSLSAVAVLALILFYVGRQSYLFEKQRNQVQKELAISRVKYKRLVETATEPILMFYEGKCIYSNRSLQTMMGATRDELDGIEAEKLFALQEGAEGLEFISDGNLVEGQFNSRLLTVAGDAVEAMLSISNMNLNGREAAIINIKDVTTTRRIELELDQSKERYRQLTSRLHIAVFRTEADKRFKLIEANASFYDLLGISGGAEAIALDEIFIAKKVSSDLFEEVLQEGFVKNRIVSLQGNDAEKISQSHWYSPGMQREHRFIVKAYWKMSVKK